MATYLALNLIFILVTTSSIAAITGWHWIGKAFWATLLLLLILTAVFDNLIVGLSIVGYDTAKILQIYIGKAPIEDFMYTILAVVLVPAMWRLFGANHGR